MAQYGKVPNLQLKEIQKIDLAHPFLFFLCVIRTFFLFFFVWHHPGYFPTSVVLRAKRNLFILFLIYILLFSFFLNIYLTRETLTVIFVQRMNDSLNFTKNFTSLLEKSQIYILFNPSFLSDDSFFLLFLFILLYFILLLSPSIFSLFNWSNKNNE